MILRRFHPPGGVRMPSFWRAQHPQFRRKTRPRVWISCAQCHRRLITNNSKIRHASRDSPFGHDRPDSRGPRRNVQPASSDLSLPRKYSVAVQFRFASDVLGLGAISHRSCRTRSLSDHDAAQRCWKQERVSRRYPPSASLPPGHHWCAKWKIP